ncbi:MAG TPA: hypothetical protein DDW84_08810 [Phycisphaerales bacterium]|nr:MAG: hypothetical protein A2Y13_09595 [Planctomycetes bacterium GWC2_45_44]HBG78919.1 hypothetical protein [Phycisphaerales bacterium]HBR18866.1 hypothetical protein [Phycisphaerales bacterium]
MYQGTDGKMKKNVQKPRALTAAKRYEGKYVAFSHNGQIISYGADSASVLKKAHEIENIPIMIFVHKKGIPYCL